MIASDPLDSAASPNPLAEFQPPDQYRVGAEIARGGMGVILNAKDLKIERRVAMKIMTPAKQESRERTSRFIQEARVLARLEHPGIVPIHDLGQDKEGRLFYTMKLVKGVTLGKALASLRQGSSDAIAQFPFSRLLAIFQKVCDTIAFAHSRGVIHRDLKPDNIMIGEYGEVLVLDWGLAKIVDQAQVIPCASRAWNKLLEFENDEYDPVRTLDGTIVGSPGFMAPEQIEGGGDLVDQRTDIFALGAILYNILTLQPPVTGLSISEIVEKVRKGDIAPPAAVHAKNGSTKLWTGRIPESLSAVVMKALAFEKEDRYGEVSRLSNDIEAFQRGFATSAEHADLTKQIILLVRRHKAKAAILAAAMAISVTCFAVMVGSNNRMRRTLNELAASSSHLAANLVTEGKFEEALEKVSNALRLSPKEAEYHLQNANILQVLLRFNEAALEYTRVLAVSPTHERAKENLALCRSMKIEAGKPTIESLRLLHASLLRQGRSAEALPISTLLGKNQQDRLAVWQARLDSAKITPQNFKLMEDGTFILNLDDVAISDLTSLRGMPISILSVRRTKVTDLRPVKDMPLREVFLAETAIRDLSPLKGMSLTNIDLWKCPISDISALKGMPLVAALLSNTEISDL
ncbi:MAG TPA: protein kinase, partial [Verrucomicrobiae bacterium]|nr:protein kinase [Verrucomicrobiae bacterium]